MIIQKLEAKNAANIARWCEGKGKDFLAQWAGRGYEYPLTAEQITARLADGAEIYQSVLDGEMVGTIEIIEREAETKSALIGRFVLNPERTGKGLGSQTLKAFMDYCQNELGLEKVRLFVFDFNIPAYKCYEKCGFSETERVTRPNGWKAIGMEREI